MSYFLTGDEFADDPAWEVLAEGKAALIDALQASYQRLCAKSAHQRHDGYLTEQTAQRWASSRRVLTLLTMSVLGHAPKLHKRGDECECLGDSWIDGFTYRIHRFLKRNASRKEQDRRTRQKAELRDTALRHRVWLRDGGCCRYCGSGVLNKKSGRAKDRRKVLHFDHVDPDLDAGGDESNLVTCCARCNEFKGKRTPAEADMALLPVPTAAQIAEWADRPPVTRDLPLMTAADHLAISDQINAGSATDQQHDVDRGVERRTDPGSPPGAAPDDDTRAQPSPQHTAEQADQRPSQPAKGPGRVGDRLPPRSPRTGALGQPVRAASEPDIYHGRSRPPAPQTSPPAPPEVRPT
ncbi:HNH endonuclease [Umezawaea beigongshangensis]|uniref:HNH endonuclease n=1 Tax=Umezawaea beigongshangensis TaxID=2780383 RepID=UPI0018F25484|nr:HNH endonuclease [Umezawaea beigongshangensis]